MNGPKGVKATIQGDELRVSSKSRDDLQSVISLLKGADLDVDLQFRELSLDTSAVHVASVHY